MTRALVFVALSVVLSCVAAINAAGASASEPPGDRNLGTHCVYPEDAFFHFGKGGRVLDVRQPPFGAKGDGVTDDTAALVKAYDFVANKIRQYGIHNPQASFIIYLPRGTYLVSDTILYSPPFVDYTSSHPGYEGMAGTRFVGEERATTIIRLKNNCPGFESGKAKAVVQFARTDFNNAETKNVFRHITIDTGRSNPGAVGLDFNGANGVSIADVAVRSADGMGHVGIHFRVPPTQGYHHDLTVTGFDYGISCDPYHAMQNSFEFVTLREQRKAALRVLQSGVSIRKLRSENTVPALSQEMPGSHLILLDSELGGGPADETAICSAQGQLFVRNVSLNGYGKAIEKDRTTLIERTRDEYVSGPVFAHSEQIAKRSMNLPIKEVPLVLRPDDTAKWANVNDYGATGDGKTDDSTAIQRAMNAGKPVVYFPGRHYHVARPVSVPASVQRIEGLFAHFGGDSVIFKVDADSAQPVLFEDACPGRGVFCEHAAPRTVVLECIAASGSLYRNRNTARTTIFVNACNGLGKPGSPIVNEDAYCRLINTEFKGGPNFCCDRGAIMWVFGFKVESTQESFLVKDGGRLEVLGGVSNQTPFTANRDSAFPKDSTRNIVRNLGGDVSVVLHTNGHMNQPIGYRTAVVDGKVGATEEILLKHLPLRPGTGVASRPGQYRNEFFLPLYVHYRPAGEVKLTMPQHRANELQSSLDSGFTTGITYNVRHLRQHAHRKEFPMKRTLAFSGLIIAVVSSAGLAAEPREKSPLRSVKDLQLRVSENGRYFVDQQGKPFFYLGDTCWLLFQRLNREEVDEYLKDRAGKGFTVIQAYVLRGLGQKHPDGNSSLLGAAPLIERDPTRPNEEFFKNVDYVVNRANELGLVMGLVPAKSWHVTDHPEKVFDEKNADSFGRFLGDRYRHNAVIWFPGGDSAPGKYEPVWVAIAKGLKDGSGGSQLVCYHGSGGTSSSMWFHQAGWLDFNSIQSGHRFESDSYAFVSKDYALRPAKPTVDMEPAYENHPTGANKPRIDAHKVRSQAYSAMLAGAAGHGYGAMDLFYFYKDADGPFPKNGFQHWRKAMAYEGSGQVGLMRRLFEQRPWYKMVPDQSAIASDQGDGTERLVAARAEDGSFVIAYTPLSKPLDVRMDKISGKKVKARWFDPRDGAWREIGEFANTGTRQFAAPSQEAQSDWVLVLEDAAYGDPTR